MADAGRSLHPVIALEILGMKREFQIAGLSYLRADGSDSRRAYLEIGTPELNNEAELLSR